MLFYGRGLADDVALALIGKSDVVLCSSRDIFVTEMGGNGRIADIDCGQIGAARVSEQMRVQAFESVPFC